MRRIICDETRDALRKALNDMAPEVVGDEDVYASAQTNPVHPRAQPWNESSQRVGLGFLIRVSSQKKRDGQIQFHKPDEAKTKSLSLPETVHVKRHQDGEELA